MDGLPTGGLDVLGIGDAGIDVDIGDCHRGTLGRQQSCCFSPDTRGTSGNQRHLAAYIVHTVTPLQNS